MSENEKEACKIGEKLVEERLVGCVNIIPHLKSLYWWEGKINHAVESLMFVKTRRDLLEKVIERVKELHSYSNPAIFALSILDGNKYYLELVRNETQEL
ncbi:MAG: divalent-cation tolerance protein CutA [Candidatus Hodarchaeota archaeon]